MDSISQIFDFLTYTYGIWGLCLMIAIVVLFVIQAVCYFCSYAPVAKFSNNRRKGIPREGSAAVSVVVVVHDDMWYLENVLPALLAQDHHNYEIVVVEVGTTEDFSDNLEMIKNHYPHLTTTKIEQDPRFPISDKMAYNVGIKAASYENIILTTSDAVPRSPKWLSMMAKGFSNGEIVLGYCGMEKGKGFVNKMMRCSRLSASVRWLSAAVKGKPYRGILHNLGFTRSIYFASRGFGYLNMNLGEDDLFIMKIATAENTSIIINPHATVRQQQWGGFGWWWQERKFRSSAYRYYPSWVKGRTEWELGSRALFYLAVIAAVIILPFEIKLGAAGIWLLRAFIVRRQMWLIRKRLGENRLGWAYFLYDIIAPFTEAALAISRRIRPAAGIWR